MEMLVEEVAQVVAGRRLGHGAGRRLRLQAGLSVEELASVIGADPAQLSRWERGLAHPRPRAAVRWLAALDELRQGLDRPLAEPVA
jgi:transcriptional regulator with XRE-family HTH domain